MAIARGGRAVAVWEGGGRYRQVLVTSIRGQDVTAGGWIIAAGRRGAWYPASAPLLAASVRGFEVTAGGEVVVRVATVPSAGV